MRRAVFTLLSLSLSLNVFAQLPEQVSPHRYEKVSLRAGDGSPEAVGAMLEGLKLSGFPEGSGLKARSVKESPGGWHYDYAQVYEDIEVFEGSIHATLDKTGRVMALINGLLGFEAADGEHGMDKNMLDAYVVERFCGGGDCWHEVKLVWMAEGGRLKPAYLAEYSEGITTMQVLMDAGSLEVIRRRDLGVYHHAMRVSGTDSVQGSAYVFDPDPRTPTAAPYAGAYMDNFDADNPTLTAARVLVTLQDISFNGNAYILEGPHVKLAELENPASAPVTSADGNFHYTRMQSGFEDVMVYYHIDQYQRYIQSLGFTNLYNAPLMADAHGLMGQDNSHFVPQGASSRVAFGEGGVDDAEDADVILHEYGHALSYAGLQGANSGTERQGLDEGIGDYIAASYSKSKYYNFWKNTFSWDGHNEFWDGRSASTSMMYPPSSPNFYTYGEIWATALMEVYDMIGRTASDRVFFQSLYSNAANTTLNDAAHVILDADSLLYGGAHTAQYQAAFCARGIFTGAECIVGVDDPADAVVDFEIFPNPTEGRFTVRLGQRVRNAELRVVDALGRVLVTQAVTGLEAEVDLGGMGAGMYVVWMGGKGLRVVVSGE